MASPVRRVVMVLCFVLALVGGFWWAFQPKPVSSPSPAVSVEAPRVSGARTRVPRVIKTNTSGSDGVQAHEMPGIPSAAASSGSAPPSNSEQSDGPVDRRENPPQNGGPTAQAIRSKMDEVTDEMAECLGEWMALDPSLEGKVSMGFRIGPDGLQDAWVVDHTDVPFGPLSCFGSAIYSADWTGVSAEPVEVTFPFVFTQGGDEGATNPG